MSQGQYRGRGSDGDNISVEISTHFENSGHFGQILLNFQFSYAAQISIFVP